MVKDSVAILAQAGSADSATRTDSLFSHCWVSFSISQDGSISRDQSWRMLWTCGSRMLWHDTAAELQSLRLRNCTKQLAPLVLPLKPTCLPCLRSCWTSSKQPWPSCKGPQIPTFKVCAQSACQVTPNCEKFSARAPKRHKGWNLNPKPVRFGVTNPTQLLRKLELVQEWDLDIICLSETSHTTKFIPALYSQSRAVGYNLAISDPVPDKFAVADPNGSLVPRYSCPFSFSHFCTEAVLFATFGLGLTANCLLGNSVWSFAPALYFRLSVPQCAIVLQKIWPQLSNCTLGLANCGHHSGTSVYCWWFQLSFVTLSGLSVPAG